MMRKFSYSANRLPVQVRVIDFKRPEQTRWSLQWAINRAGGRQALRGLTDAAARQGKWHVFTALPGLLERFRRDVYDLLKDRKIEAIFPRRTRRR